MAEIFSSKKKLDGKVAIITGGASGIGEATTRLFATNGIRGVVIADIQEGERVVESIGSNICSYFHCDVTDEEQVKSMVEFTISSYGQLDIMFSNSDIFNTSQTILDLDLSLLDCTYSINARGMVACVKHSARVMVDRKIKGSIICRASVTGSMGGEKSTDYFMVDGVHGIRVNSLAPFEVATPLLVNAMNESVEETEKRIQSFTCLKNVVLKVEHVVDAVLFLASRMILRLLLDMV
ncbi:hypothetical protein Leryth_022455 [Lithospermum erythrorhizon]|nr:hypothetical protein Leryth_022455 [Lithospermum erythrorhizon]